MRTTIRIACFLVPALASCATRIVELDGNAAGPSGPVDELAMDDGDPSLVVALREEVYQLAADSSRIYWAAATSDGSPEAGWVRSCRQDDCAHTIVTYANGRYDQFGALFSDGKTIYWLSALLHTSNFQRVSSCPVEGCEGSLAAVTLEATGAGGAAPNEVTSFAVEGDDMYWTSDWPAGVLRCQISDCASTVRQLAKPVDQPRNLTLTRDAVYWHLEDVVERVAKTGGAIDEIATGQNRPNVLAAFGDAVYWTNQFFPGAVLRCPATGTCDAPAVVAKDQHYPNRLHVDASGVLWTTSPPGDDGSIWACPLEGCSSGPELLVSRAATYGPIAVSGNKVYWTSIRRGTGTSAVSSIHRTEK